MDLTRAVADVVWTVVYGIMMLFVYLEGISICVENSSHDARCDRVAQSSRDGSVGIADILDGPHTLLLVEAGGAITAAIVGVRLASPWFYAGAILVAIGTGLAISAALCRSRLRPYALGALVVAGSMLLSPRLGTYLGALLLVLAVGYEARVLPLLLVVPDQVTPARLHSVTAVLGANAVIAALAATSPLLAVLSLEIFFLGALLVYSLRDESRRLAARIERLGRLRPYGWLARKSIPALGGGMDAPNGPHEPTL